MHRPVTADGQLCKILISFYMQICIYLISVTNNATFSFSAIGTEWAKTCNGKLSFVAVANWKPYKIFFSAERVSSLLGICLRGCIKFG